MSRRLRLVTGLAIAQVVVAAALLSLRNFKLPVTLAGDIASAHLGGVVAVPTVVLWITTVLLAAAWAYLLAGAFYSRLPLALAGLSLFTAAMLFMWLNSGFGGPSAVIEVVLVASIWAGRAAVEVSRRRAGRRGTSGQGDAKRPGVVLPTALFVLVGGLYATFWFAPSSNGPASEQFASAVFEQLGVLALVLVPALLLAGSEFGEWGEVAGDGLAAAVSRLRRPQSELVLALLVAAAVLVHTAVATGLHLLEELPAAVATAMVVALVVLRLRDQPLRWPHAVPYLGVALVAVTIYVATVGDALVRSSSAVVAAARQESVGGELTGYGQTVQPPFAIRFPAEWTVIPEGALKVNSA